MNNIWKFTLEVTGEQTLSMPIGARILTAQVQNTQLGTKQICLWAIVNKRNGIEDRKFYIYGTGHNIDIKNKEYIATVQEENLVWHIFQPTQQPTKGE